jgi:hypothetical protein
MYLDIMYIYVLSLQNASLKYFYRSCSEEHTSYDIGHNYICVMTTKNIFKKCAGS